MKLRYDGVVNAKLLPSRTCITRQMIMWTKQDKAKQRARAIAVFCTRPKNWWAQFHGDCYTIVNL